MRAREPDASGFVERDGVVLHYEVFGDGKPTVMMLPTWSIVHSGVWKAQIPFLARHFRVVTFDGRGCGRSGGRPALGHTSTNSSPTTPSPSSTGLAPTPPCSWRCPPVPVGASTSPPSIPNGSSASFRSVRILRWFPTTSVLSASVAPRWAKPNSPYWEQDFSGFIEFFMERMFTEPHSTKPIEDAIEWGLDIGPITLPDTYRGIHLTDPQWFRMDVQPTVLPRARDPRRRGRHPPARQWAPRWRRSTNGQLVTIAGGGHAPNLRDPVVVNRLIREFVESVALPDMAGYR